MTVKLLTEHHLEFQKEASEARLRIHLSKCQIVGNLMPRLNLLFFFLLFFLFQCFVVVTPLMSRL